MNGALMTASSRFAIAAALGLVVGVGSARAADLGGNCCADLEERVAELEATTARKGNRKMSLTITGQLNRLIMAWDDGHSRGIYYGIDSVNTSSRFSFLGEAAATPWLKFGFEIMLEGEGTSASNRVSQLNEDGSFSATTYFTPSRYLGPQQRFQQRLVLWRCPPCCGLGRAQRDRSFDGRPV